MHFCNPPRPIGRARPRARYRNAADQGSTRQLPPPTPAHQTDTTPHATSLSPLFPQAITTTPPAPPPPNSPSRTTNLQYFLHPQCLRVHPFSGSGLAPVYTRPPPPAPPSPILEIP